jgi:hypothetical protein
MAMVFDPSGAFTMKSTSELAKPDSWEEFDRVRSALGVLL